MSLEVYGALLLHKAGKEINEANLKNVLGATGAKVEDAKIKALVANLDGVNIDDAIKQAAVMPAAVSAPIASEKKSAEKPKEEKKDTEEAAAGLGALFG
ncbi:50S ribosomal protein P1 [Candidatus Woesearchaeota archaeon]|nr:50S ribosomal protein P1 [Candidatus Woesearchaeota archaeon]